MKKLFTLLLALLLLCSGCGSPQIEEEPDIPEGMIPIEGVSAYEGDIENGVPHGYGEMVFHWSNEKSFHTYQGQFVNGQFLDTQGTMYFQNGDIYKGGWNASWQQGPGILRTDEGENFEQFYNNGELLYSIPYDKTKPLTENYPFASSIEAMFTSPSTSESPVESPSGSTSSDPQTVTSITIPDGAYLPDLQAFSGNTGSQVETIFTTSTKQGYFFSYNGKFIKEYMDLINSNPDFQLRYAENIDYMNDGSGIYTYDYVGSDAVDTFDSSMSYIDGKGISLFILIYAAGNSIQFDIQYADGISYVDTGHRTNQNLSPYEGSPAADSSSVPSASAKSNVAEFAKLDCLTCKGSTKCKTCGGYGYTQQYGLDDVKGSCKDCNGTGKCRSCGGTGKR